MPITIRQLLGSESPYGANGHITKFNYNFNALAGLINTLEYELDVLKASVTPGALNDLRQALRNYVDNAGPDIWQRGVGPFYGVGNYLADRWYIGSGLIQAIRSSGYVGNYSILTTGTGKIYQDSCLGTS